MFVHIINIGTLWWSISFFISLKRGGLGPYI